MKKSNEETKSSAINSSMEEIFDHIKASDDRYGDFTSTHEALGVATEEFAELIRAVRRNAIYEVREEAIDLAAVCIRLACVCLSNQFFRERSTK